MILFLSIKSDFFSESVLRMKNFGLNISNKYYWKKPLNQSRILNVIKYLHIYIYIYIYIYMLSFLSKNLQELNLHNLELKEIHEKKIRKYFSLKGKYPEDRKNYDSEITKKIVTFSFERKKWRTKRKKKKKRNTI